LAWNLNAAFKACQNLAINMAPSLNQDHCAPFYMEADFKLFTMMSMTSFISQKYILLFVLGILGNLDITSIDKTGLGTENEVMRASCS
jgi:uncharacterized membrane protein